MKQRLMAVCVLVMSLLLVRGQFAAAQDITLNVNQFWERLNQTDQLLDTITAQSDPTATLNLIRAFWEGVAQVRLANGNLVAVDLGWIRAALTDGQPATLEALHRQVKALIAYHENQTEEIGAADKNPSLAALAEVLRDPRFQYVDITPTPIPDQPQEKEIPQSNAISSLAQIILLVASVGTVIVVFVYFARNLQVQQAAVETAPNIDPTTSGDAQNLATNHAQSEDYRSAVRYLYLASLLMLDERGVIHYDSSLTNREHLRHLRDKPQVYDILRQVINAFEEVWYGYLPINEAYYQHFRQQVDELNRMVA